MNSILHDLPGRGKADALRGQKPCITHRKGEYMRECSHKIPCEGFMQRNAYIARCRVYYARKSPQNHCWAAFAETLPGHYNSGVAASENSTRSEWVSRT
jgi:hypothetical protein